MRGILDLFFNISKDEHIGLSTIRPMDKEIEAVGSLQEEDDCNIGFLNLVKQSY